MPDRPPTQRPRGFTLIELVISIVALAALFAGIATVFVTGPAASADPQIRAQARAIAEGYVEEILLKRYCDNPDEPDENGGPCSDETGSSEGTESRATYNDVCDYNEIVDKDPMDQDGTPSAVGALTDYDVTVVVGDGMNDCETGDGPQRIQVTVSHTSGVVNFELVSQRAEY